MNLLCRILEGGLGHPSFFIDAEVDSVRLFLSDTIQLN